MSLLQIWLANLMPSIAFLPLTALMASAGVVNGCKFFGALNSSSGQGLWRNWQDFLGVLGIAMLPQVAPDSTSIPAHLKLWLVPRPSLAQPLILHSYPCTVAYRHALLSDRHVTSEQNRACSCVCVVHTYKILLLLCRASTVAAGLHPRAVPHTVPPPAGGSYCNDCRPYGLPVQSTTQWFQPTLLQLWHSHISSR